MDLTSQPTAAKGALPPQALRSSPVAALSRSGAFALGAAMVSFDQLIGALNRPEQPAAAAPPPARRSAASDDDGDDHADAAIALPAVAPAATGGDDAVPVAVPVAVTERGEAAVDADTAAAGDALAPAEPAGTGDAAAMAATVLAPPPADPMPAMILAAPAKEPRSGTGAAAAATLPAATPTSGAAAADLTPPSPTQPSAHSSAQPAVRSEPAPVRSTPPAALAPQAALAAQIGRNATTAAAADAATTTSLRGDGARPVAPAGTAVAPAAVTAVQPAAATAATPAAAHGAVAAAGVMATSPAAAAARAEAGSAAISTGSTGGPTGGTPLPGASAAAGTPASTGEAAAARKPAAGHPADPAFRAKLIRDQVDVQLRRAVGDGLDRIEIRLRPEQLGRVEIRLEIGRDGRVSAAVTADRPETLELLRNDPRGLERTLQDAGLKADAGSLSFSLRGEQGRGDGGRDDPDRPVRSSIPATDAAADAMAPAWLPRSDMIGPDRVDIRA